jgi:hypothetical protein
MNQQKGDTSRDDARSNPAWGGQESTAPPPCGVPDEVREVLYEAVVGRAMHPGREVILMRHAVDTVLAHLEQVALWCIDCGVGVPVPLVVDIAHPGDHEMVAAYAIRKER